MRDRRFLKTRRDARTDSDLIRRTGSTLLESLEEMSGTVSPAPSPLGSDSGRAHEEPQVQEREKEAESGEARTAGYRRIGSGCESKRARRTTSTSMDASQEDVIIIEDEDDHVAVEDGIKGAGMFKLVSRLGVHPPG